MAGKARIEIEVVGRNDPREIEIGDYGGDWPIFVNGDHMSQVIVRAKHLEGPEVFFWEHNCRDQLREGGKDPRSVKPGGTVEEHVNAGWRVYASTSKPF